MKITNSDRSILRGLARRVADIADDPLIAGRRQRWVAHNSLRSTCPMMLVFPEGSWCELLPDVSLKCADRSARTIEFELRRRIYGWEHFRDDTVVEKNLVVGKQTTNSGWGLEAQWIQSPEARGARHFDPVIKDPADLSKLRFPEIGYDEKASLQAFSEMQDLFGDILNVTLEGVKHISYHLMRQYTELRGLEEVMVDMYAEPQMLHDAMRFLEKGHRRVLRQYVEQNLLSFNNDNTYHSSGGNSYTDELPLPDADPQHARPQDMWASAEAQEMAQVSPEHHAEFVLQYEKRLLEPFGLTGYGCCEDLTRKLGDVFTIPHIRRISISPWSDVDACAEKLKGDFIFSWKPNPAHLVGHFNENAVREYIRHTVEVAQRNGCVLEMILKDTHTCEHHPERFDRWTQIAREVILEAV
ncbi:MAG: hypothetical protein KJ964_04125 [Verrucomicrobia bacterium]|nr:hypothetical protein [Verrucomicrobiota bacterium]MBU1735291.1 hypothetical protein [Verrucomicrobiota bacterium]MBU1856144.1 hypothetical protein [Verrucomicrobiota bacterium]